MAAKGTKGTSPHPVTESKRGRGRPRLANALTPAQRAKRYRDNKRVRQAATGAGITRSPGSGQVPTSDVDRVEALSAENARLRDALEAACIRINDLAGALELFVTARGKNKKITADQMKGLHALLALDHPLAEHPLRDRRKK